MNPDYNDAGLAQLSEEIANNCAYAALAIGDGDKAETAAVLQHAAHMLHRLLESGKKAETDDQTPPAIQTGESSMNPDYNDAELVHLLNLVADYCIDAAYAIEKGGKAKAGDILQRAAQALRQLLQGEKK